MRRDAAVPGIHRVCTLLAALACLTLLPSTLATHVGMKAVINGTERDHPPEYGEDMNPKNNLAMCNPPNNADGACCAMGHGGGWGWLPAFHNEYLWSPGLRGFLYGVGLIWAFFGVAILSDAFMAGIETITGTTKIVKSKGPNGEDIETEELVWNPAVANLSLLALGSSAPEIMMSCIEIAANQGKFGAIGAPTVVGSASFNLFVIVGLCMLAIPEGENRKIDGVPGFICTSIASVFSYSWVCIIVLVITPNVVTFAEALITFLYMPLLVVMVYVIDAGLIPGLNNTASVAPEEGETPGGGGASEGQVARAPSGQGSTSVLSPRPVAQSAAVVNHAAMAAYRHAAKGGVMGGGARIDHAARKEQLKDDEALAESSGLPVFVMEAGKLSVLETVGMAKLIVLRIGNTDSPATVDFETKDGTAKAGSHYEHNSGTIEFAKGETQRDIFIKIIHDEKFNDDLSFSLNLSVKDASTAKLGRQNSCQLTIIDMDGPGIFVWQDDVKHQYKSTDSKVPLLIERNKGATGDSCVRVVTVDGTAQAGTHFEKLEEEILFKNNVAVKTVKIDLQKFDKPEGSPEDYKVSFFVDLQDVPEKAGGATLGDITRVEVEITHNGDDEDEEHLTFADQFRQAMAVNGGEDVDQATAVDYTMHYISITWKIIAAAVPPTHHYGGWPTFWVSMAFVGIVTGIIGDIATVFSCIVGLDPETAGIFLVALGTSLPDTFASILAIKHDDNADNAVGNVTGSNAVNVFLGLGMPWLAATIYWNGVFPSGWTEKEPFLDGTQKNVCTDMTPECLKDNWARYDWLATYQGPAGSQFIDDNDRSDRPFSYRLLAKYLDVGSPDSKYDKNIAADVDASKDALTAQAAFLPEFEGAGGFVVVGGKLGFNTFMFSILCIVAFSIIAFNKCAIGPEAAGPVGNKIQAGIYFSLWAVFIIVGAINNQTNNSLNFM